MNKRLFTFGCSFTNWKWPSWNDYIGLNFDEYYSLGCGGADNRYILYRFLEADRKYKFTSDDTIMVMFTSFNRMSYVGENNFRIHNIGDLVDHNVKAHPIGKNYNFATAVYDSCIAIQSIESILESKNVKYEFLQSMKHNFYHDDFEMGGEVKDHLDYCLGLFKYPVMENWVYENYDFLKEKIIWQDEGNQDGHPTMKHHLDFVKEFFPQYITDKVIQYYDINQEKFSDENTEQQEKIYWNSREEFFKNEKIKIDTE
jgi:hypothetical protein|tara:strand:- start:1325 stop:2095 length:771 start_codon:yes stop_codon:yes gene_type:complete